jgi:glycosyltransferase involved in cell wall biosynthesis
MSLPNIHFYIVTPSYNSVRYIDETILSVVSQVGDFSIHYHVQDGGSTDGTVGKLRAWEDYLHLQNPIGFCNTLTFTWDSGPDNGMYDAINKGFEYLAPPPSGIMAWVNADDPYFPHAFSTASKAFTDIQNMEWFGGAIAIMHETETLEFFPECSQPYPLELIKEYCCDDRYWRVLQQNGIFWKGALWQKAGPLNASLRYAGDFELWPRFARYAEFMHCPIVLGIFRSRYGQLSRDAKYVDEMEQVCPIAVREIAARAFWRKQKGPPLASTLRLDENGNFSICRQQTFPNGKWWKQVIRSLLPKKMVAVIQRLRKRKSI